MIQGLRKEITEIPAFGHDITEVRAMGQLVWQKSIPDYLCFTALEAGQFTLTIPAAVTSTYLSYVEYSLDGQNWTRLTIDSTDQTITTPTVAAGGKVYWRGSGVCMTPNYTAADRASRFSSTGEFDMSGHLLSLLKGSDYDNLSGIGNYTFCNLFFQSSGSLGVVHAHDLVMPPLNKTGVFFRLFRGCTSLLTAPALPQTSVPSWGFREMFYGCTSLTGIADMVATSYGGTCCLSMYYGCTSLTSVTLPTPTTFSGDGQFQLMFYNCANLAYVKWLITDLSVSNLTLNWLYGVSSTGTFIQASGVEWPRGASGIPTGWVDIEKRTMPSGYKQVEYVANPNKGAFNFEHVFDSATETLEIQFFNIEKKGFFIGTTNNGGYYGAICVDKSTNTAIRIKVGIGDVTVNTTTISVTSEKPHVFRYKGKSDGFTIYLNGVAQKVYSGGFNTEHTISNLYVYSAADTASAVETYPDWFGECPLYSIKVLDANDAAIINLIPCVRESDNLVGFYDFGRNKFYFSANGNDFTAGEEI